MTMNASEANYDLVLTARRFVIRRPASVAPAIWRLPATALPLLDPASHRALGK
jgi:hypothetical protein